MRKPVSISGKRDDDSYWRAEIRIQNRKPARSPRKTTLIFIDLQIHKANLKNKSLQLEALR